MSKKVLVACEESQTVCKAFRARGFEAYSCDIQDCSGGHPEWHILGDAIEALRGGVVKTMDMQLHDVGRWDLAICHPPCTDLAVSGARHFPEKQKDLRQQKAVAFFMQMFMANANSIAVENPVCIMSSCYRKPDQIIQPYEYGDPHKKTTCLWLVNLPCLKPTNIVYPSLVKYKCKNGKTVTFDEFMVKGFAGNRVKARSKTFPGIAEAMAEQWGDYIRKDGESDERTD